MVNLMLETNGLNAAKKLLMKRPFRVPPFDRYTNRSFHISGVIRQAHTPFPNQGFSFRAFNFGVDHHPSIL